MLKNFKNERGVSMILLIVIIVVMIVIFAVSFSTAKDLVDSTKAKIMYVCNMMTQPGETDNFTVTDHVKKLNEYLGKRNIDLVLAPRGSTVPTKDYVIVTSSTLRDYIDAQTITVEEDVIVEENTEEVTKENPQVIE